MKITKLMLVAATLLMSVGAKSVNMSDPVFNPDYVKPCAQQVTGNQHARTEDPIELKETEKRPVYKTAVGKTSDHQG